MDSTKILVKLVPYSMGIKVFFKKGVIKPVWPRIISSPVVWCSSWMQEVPGKAKLWGDSSQTINFVVLPQEFGRSGCFLVLLIDLVTALKRG